MVFFSFFIIKLIGDIIDNINKFLWGITSIILIISGIYFSKKLNYIQFNIKELLSGQKKEKNSSVSPFETLMLTLAGKIGVGSLAGIALAIYLGGPGTIFWLWISTLILVPNAYVEGYLGVLFHKKENGFYNGGPHYYIENGLGKKKTAKFYSLLVLLTYLLGFLPIQANTVSKSFNTIIHNELIIGVITAILFSLIIFKGMKGIISATSKLMPIVGICFLGAGFYILLKNIYLVIPITKTIIIDAFHPKTMKVSFITSLIIGLQRGIFSHEAGTGSGAIAAATVDSNDAKGQGRLQIIGVYFTSLVLCSLSTFIILMSDYKFMSLKDINGIEIMQYAMEYHLGSFGLILLLFVIFIFAFSTIITGYYYSENCFKFIFKNTNSKTILLFKIFSIFLLIIGSIVSPSYLWVTVDTLLALMTIVNVWAMFKHKDKIN